MNIFQKIVIGVAVFFGVFGIIGMGYIAVRDSGKVPPRPDLRTEALIAGANPTGRVSVYVTRNRKVVYDKHWPADGVTNETTYYIGNLDETLIAMTMMRLHERDRLDYDQELGEYLPNAADAMAGITVRQLLTHTSGLEPTSRYPDELNKTIESGTQSVYARVNYELLNALITAFRGEPASSVIQREVVDPLDLKNTLFRDAGEHGPAGWYSTLADLAAWEDWLNSNRLVRLKTMLEGFTPYRLANGEKGTFTFGWRSEEYRGLRMERIFANVGGANGCIVRFPQKNFAFVVLSDEPLTNLDMEKISIEITEFYIGREMRYPPPEA